MRRHDGGLGSAAARRDAGDPDLAAGTVLDWPRTLVARGRSVLQREHLRRGPEQPLGDELHCFVLDCSASMRSGGLARAKGLLLNLLDEAYRRRDRVALLCFAGTTVELRLPPRRAAVWNEQWIAPIAGGGGTPLALGVAAADRLLRRSRARRSTLWLLTDGRSREQPPAPLSADALCVVDFESARLPLARASQLAAGWGAAYLRYSELEI